MDGGSALLVTALALCAAAAPPREIPVMLALPAELGSDVRWRRALDRALGEATRVLGPRLGARFALASVIAWPAAGESLEELLDELAARAPAPVGRVVVGVAEAPRAASASGRAEYQEGRIVIRTPGPGAVERLLVHELAHLFGAVHRPGSRGLMAANAPDLELDPLNARLVALHGERRLAPHLFPLPQDRLDAAREAYQAAAADAPLEAGLHIAQLALECGKPGAALAAAEGVLRGDAGSVEGYVLRGIALRRLDRPREAVVAYEAALARRPRQATLHYNLAIALDRLGERERSLQAYERAIELDPRHVSALSNLARVLARGGDARRAMTLARRALEVAPEFTEARVNLSLAHLESDAFEAAESEARRAVAERPELAEAHEALGGALLARRQVPEAVQCFARAGALRPDEPRFRQQLAVSLLGLGRLQRAVGESEALASLERACAADPENADVLSELAELRFERGLSSPAREDYLRLLRLRPDDATAHNNLAVLLFRAGDVSGARRHVAEALRLGLAVHPDFLAALAQAPR